MTEPITAENLAEWRALVTKATPGPWTAELSPFGDDMQGTYYDGACPHGCPDEDCSGHVENPPYWLIGPNWIEIDEFQLLNEGDAAFISASPAIVAALLDEVERMRAAAEKLWDWLDDIDTLSDACKYDREAFYAHAMRIVVRRHELAKSDGYTLDWQVQP